MEIKNEADLKTSDLKNNNYEKEKSFSKSAFLKSGKYSKDIVNAVLEDGKRYTEKEAKSKIEKYLNGRVI